MKKSVKSLLLALMVLCLSATAGFAATTSFNVSFDLIAGSGDLTSTASTAETSPLTLGSTGSIDVALSKDLFNSKIVAASFDDHPFTLLISTDKTATISFDLDVSFDIAQISFDGVSKDIVSTSLKSGVVFAPDSGDVQIRMSFFASPDVYVGQITITAQEDSEAAGDSFSDVVITVTDADDTEVASFDLKSTDTTLKFTAANASFDSVSADVLKEDIGDYSVSEAGTLTFTLSGTNSNDVKAVYAVVDSASEDITKTYSSGYDIEADTTFMFVFASGEKFGGVQFTVAVGGNDDDESTGLDIGTIAITDEDGALSLTLTSDNITAASTDSTVPAIKDIATTSDRTASLSATGGTITIDLTSADENLEINSVDVYFTSDSGTNYSDVTVTRAANTRTFELGTTSGLYRVRFTVKDADETIWYFTAGITYTYSSGSGITDEQEASLISTDVAKTIAAKTVTSVSASNIPSATLTNLLSALGLTESQITNRVVFFAIPSGYTLASGTTIGVNLVPVDNSNGDNPDYDEMLSGYYKTSTAFSSGYFAVDTQSLTDVDTGSTLTYDPDYYLVLVTIFGGFKSSSISTAADEDATLNGGSNYLSAEKVTGSNKGSSSGCDAGFGALALLAIVPFIKKIRK